MSRKNLSVNLNNGFKDHKDLSAIFLNFKKKLDSLKKNKYLVAVSGGPDSLALVALTKAYNFSKKTKFYYLLVDHNIRKNSSQEAKKVKNLLKKEYLKLEVLLNKKKLLKTFRLKQERSDTILLKTFVKKIILK